MKELKEAQMGMIAILTLVLVSIKRRLPTRKLSSGITTTLALAGIVLLVAAGSASANGVCVWGDIDAGEYYECGDLVTKSCTLNASMDCTDNTRPGLIVGASDIVIDGAGFKMTGNEDASACAVSNVGGHTGQTKPAKHSGIINAGGFDNVVIKDLEIENFCTGIALGDVLYTGVLNNTVTQCKIHHNGNDTAEGMVLHGVHMAGASRCNITKNEISYNKGTGTTCGSGGNGIFIHGVNDAGLGGDWNNITCNYLHHNSKSGFFMKYKCMHCIISYNNATNNGEGGIVPMCKQSRYTEIKYNNMSNNAQVGYRSQGGDNDLMFNTIMNNGPLGIDLISCSDCGTNTTITNNTVCGHTTKDINVGTPGENTADSNTCGSSDIAGACDWSCANKVSAYFDYDGDGYYSDDPADCSCGIAGSGKCACCNPGVFNSSHADLLKAADICVLSGDTHDDPNDCDNTIQGEEPYYCDSDSDAHFSATPSGYATEFPPGCRSNPGDDCDDTNANVHPGATEVCNGIDDDCDGAIDEGVTTTFYRDADGDGYGDPADTTEACAAPAGYVSDNTDCDDTDANVHPGATEVCNGIDDDCDGAIDEGVTTTFYRDADGDGYGDPADTTEACTAPAGYVSDNTDCDDTNANVHPGATEVCNGIDDDCDGAIDEGVTTTFYRDVDGDGYGDPADTTEACTAPAGYVSDNTDCNDTNADVNPGATEICDNNIDDDCDGATDCDDDDCKPDLNITAKTEERINSTHYNVNYTVTNLAAAGTCQAGPSNTSISIDSGRLTMKDTTVPALNPGDSYTNTVGPFLWAAPNDTIVVCADSDDDVDESNEANNCLENTFDCPPCPKPDLVITDIWTELKRVGRNVNTTIIWYNITNNGDTTAGRTYSNLTVDDGAQPRNDRVGKLAPGQTRTEKFTYKGDPHNITVCADCRCVVTESNETNNCLSVTV